MLGRQAWVLALGLAVVLGLSASARAQNFGALGGFGGFGGATIATPGFGFTGVGVPAAVSSGGWGVPMGYGYGGYPAAAYGYGYYPYNNYGAYGYGAYGMSYGGYNSFVTPMPYVAPQMMGNNLGGLMGTIRNNTGRGNWQR